jgi:diguanylate cyclase (GGDEF)-like protein
MEELVAQGLYRRLASEDPSRQTYASTATGDRIHLRRPGRTQQQASRPTPQTVTHETDRTQPRDAAPTAARETRRPWEDDPGPSIPGSKAEESLDAAELLGEDEAQPHPSTPSDAVIVPESTQDAMGVSAQIDPETMARLEEFVDLAGIGSRLTSLAERLRSILGRVESLLPRAQARILHLEGASEEELGNGPVRRLSREELEATPHFTAALETGKTQLATTAPEGSDLSEGELAAVLPLRLGETPWGLLEITWPAGKELAARQDWPLLGSLARVVELSIANQQTLETLVFIDPLTGVYNRAFYERQLALEMERAHRTNRKFALLVMDVDDFKHINDRYGHRAGDQVLSGLAQEVRDRMRKIDLLFRYGGEEFVVLLPGAEEEEAKRTAERLRLVVREHAFEAEGAPAPLKVTLSVGGAVYPDDARTPTGLFRHADAALYAAKEQGKDRVVFR